MIDVHNDVIEIGELAGRKELHRRRRRRRQRAGKDVNDDDNDMHEVGEEDNRLTIFDSSGVSVQDCVIAYMVYEALQQQL